MNNIIYILLNESMPDLVKIGRTNRTIEQRIKELDNTSVPLPFQCFYAAEVNNAELVERRIHKVFSDKRLRGSREFFRLAPDQAVQAIKLAEIREITPKGDVIDELSDKDALEKYGSIEERKAKRLTFKGMEVPNNAILSFVRDENITCIVADENSNQVILDGESFSLSAAALKVLRNMGYNWSSARGSDHWKYEEKTLTARRLALEDKN
tara:strand:+ start:877 stop:1506 length:630 start_codon:yes stop_codon:yes gene_type:complete